jgi:hypothetical protein
MYSRKKLIEICENAIVNEKYWHDRDSSGAQQGVGKCWALLKANCPYEILTKGNLKTDKRTIWIEIIYKGFDYFELGGRQSDTFYLPTPEHLKKMDGIDWY